jgi:hypothetical protein
LLHLTSSILGTLLRTDMGNFLSKAKAPISSTQQPEKMSTTATPLKFSHYAHAQSDFKPPLIANENAFLGDVFDSTDASKPVSCGFYRLEKGTPLVYTYTYHRSGGQSDKGRCILLSKRIRYYFQDGFLWAGVLYRTKGQGCGVEGGGVVIDESADSEGRGFGIESLVHFDQDLVLCLLENSS